MSETEQRARSQLRRPAAVLRETVATAEREERRLALLALLRRPLLSADADADELAIVRRHAAWLEEWFAHHTGWRLTVNPELARLHKVPGSNADGTRGALDPASGVPFSRRRYVLFCLALAVVERGDRQTTLGYIAERVIAAAAGEPGLARMGIGFTLESIEERRDFVAVLRLLLRLGVLRRVQGDEQQYLRDQTADVLFDVVRSALSMLIAARRSPSLVTASEFEERLAELNAEPLPDTVDGRNRRIRLRLARRLLDDPVLYYEDLAADEASYFEKQRPFLMRDLSDATGLEREERAEGVALVDPTGDATDIGLPEEGTDGHVTLLLATWLAQKDGHRARSRGLRRCLAGADGTLHRRESPALAQGRHPARRRAEHRARGGRPPRRTRPHHPQRRRHPPPRRHRSLRPRGAGRGAVRRR